MNNFKYFKRFVDENSILDDILDDVIRAEEKFDAGDYDTTMLKCRTALEFYLREILKVNKISTKNSNGYNKDLFTMCGDLKTQLRLGGKMEQLLDDIRGFSNDSVHSLGLPPRNKAWYVLEKTHTFFNVSFEWYFAKDADFKRSPSSISNLQKPIEKPLYDPSDPDWLWYLGLPQYWRERILSLSLNDGYSLDQKISIIKRQLEREQVFSFWNNTRFIDISKDNVDLKPLTRFKNCTQFSFINNVPGVPTTQLNIEYLKHFTNLCNISIHGVRVIGLDVLKYLPNLKQLSLKNNQLRDVSPLRNLKGVEIDIRNNPTIENIEVLTNMKNSGEKIFANNGYELDAKFYEIPLREYILKEMERYVILPRMPKDLIEKAKEIGIKSWSIFEL